ncbi:MAG: hypothetical protein QOH58_3136 [Thermoleophilaceae bacterium]|nr:hypothetical protein [Thermoleophilaceae bacterium]
MAPTGGDFTWAPVVPNTGQAVGFTADLGGVDWGDADVGVEARTVSWSFPGASATGPTATHAFVTHGLQVVSMTLRNGVGDVTTIPDFINVNAIPSAGFSWSPLLPVIGQEVKFASESDDADGAITSYSWNFGDGSSSSLRNPAHPYADPGFKTVSLTVTDGNGAQSTATRTVVAQGLPVAANAPPSASFAYSPRSPEVGDPVEFVSTALDPEGDLSQQTWDLDGDGQFDDARGDEVLYTFVTAGEKIVRLRAEDAAGGAAVRERTLTVKQGPVARAGFLNPFPVVRLNGEILSGGARIKVLTVRAPRGTLVRVSCKGKGCPAKQRRKRVKKSGTVRFRNYERFLRAGIKLEIFSRKPNTIGAFTRYTIRAGKAPVRLDRCLEPGKSRPTRCRG